MAVAERLRSWGDDRSPNGFIETAAVSAAVFHHLKSQSATISSIEIIGAGETPALSGGKDRSLTTVGHWLGCSDSADHIVDVGERFAVL